MSHRGIEEFYYNDGRYLIRQDRPPIDPWVPGIEALGFSDSPKEDVLRIAKERGANAVALMPARDGRESYMFLRVDPRVL